jgi:hypothetical protein
LDRLTECYTFVKELNELVMDKNELQEVKIIFKKALKLLVFLIVIFCLALIVSVIKLN